MSNEKIRVAESSSAIVEGLARKDTIQVIAPRRIGVEEAMRKLSFRPKGEIFLGQSGLRLLSVHE
jgi:hypothetical protein